jgi:hypothetical protein
MAACSPSGGTAAASPTPSTAATPSNSATPSPVASPTPSATPVAITPPPRYLYVEIVGSSYGYVNAQTAAGAKCNTTVVLPNGQHALGLHNPQVGAAGGNVSWTYPTPLTAHGTGEDIVICTYSGIVGAAYDYFDLGS